MGFFVLFLKVTFGKAQQYDILLSTSLSTSKKFLIPVESIGLVYISVMSCIKPNDISDL